MKYFLTIVSALIMSSNCIHAQSVQDRLNNGETPFQVYYGNHGLMDSLYGKMYGGGLITYLDTATGEALITASIDQSNGVTWGCVSTWVSTNEDIFGGWANTQNIVGCGGPAGVLCSQLNLNNYNDWYLPNNTECKLMYKNLKSRGYGNFDYSTWQVQYWTSNQGVGSSFSNSIRYWDEVITGYTRTSPFKVRAVRKSNVLTFRNLETGVTGSYTSNGYTLVTTFSGQEPFGNIHVWYYPWAGSPIHWVSSSRDDIGLKLTKSDGSNFGVKSITIRNTNDSVPSQAILILGMTGPNTWVEYRNTIPQGSQGVKCVLPETFNNISALKFDGQGQSIMATKIEVMQ